EADATAGQLVLIGNKATIEEIVKLLKDKGEIVDLTASSYGPTVRSSHRTIALPGSAAQDRIVDALQSQFQGKYKLNIKDTRPKTEAVGGEQAYDQGYDPREGGFGPYSLPYNGPRDFGGGRGPYGQPNFDPRSAPGGPQGPAEQPRTEGHKEAAPMNPAGPARPTTSGFAAPKLNGFGKPVTPKGSPMTPPASSKPAEAPKTEAPKTEAPKSEAPKSDKMARRPLARPYQFVGFGEDEPAKETPAKSETKSEPDNPDSAKSERAEAQPDKTSAKSKEPASEEPQKPAAKETN